MVTGKKKTKGPVKSEPAREELEFELRHLRAALREVGENFILRREGEIETIIGHLAAVPAALLKTGSPAWLHELRGLKLKPAKGRMKDLKAIGELIAELADQVMSAQDGEKNHGSVRKAG